MDWLARLNREVKVSLLIGLRYSSCIQGFDRSLLERCCMLAINRLGLRGDVGEILSVPRLRESSNTFRAVSSANSFNMSSCLCSMDRHLCKATSYIFVAQQSYVDVFSGATIPQLGDKFMIERGAAQFPLYRPEVA